jgi:hypothetical protein
MFEESYLILFDIPDIAGRELMLRKESARRG